MNRLGDMRALDIFASLEVGDRSGNAEDSIVSARGETEPVEGFFQNIFRSGVELAIFTDLPRRERGVAVKLILLTVPLLREGACAVDSREDVGRAFRGVVGLIGCDFFIGKRGHFHLNVNAVEKRSADTGKIFLDILRRAGAFLCGMSVIAAFAGVHGADQHEIRGEGDLSADTRDRDASVLEGLTEHLHCLRGEFGKLVQKKHAVVGKRDLARRGKFAAARKKAKKKQAKKLKAARKAGYDPSTGLYTLRKADRIKTVKKIKPYKPKKAKK